MGFWQKLFGGSQEEPGVAATPPVVQEPLDMYTQLGLLQSVSDAEKELVSVLAASILAGVQPDSTFRVKEVHAIDTERMHLCVIASSLAAIDYPDSTFRIKNIKEL